MRKSSLEHSIAIGLGIACGTLVILGLVQFATTLSLARGYVWVAHTDEVLTEIEATVSAVQSAESAAMRYVLTGHENYVSAEKDAASMCVRHERRLQSLTSDNPRQQARLNDLEPLLEQRIRRLQDLIDTRRQLGLAESASFVAAGSGEQIMSSILGKARELRAEEYTLLAVRNEVVESRTRLALAGIALGTMAGLCLLGVAGRLIHRHIKSRRAVENELRYEKHLLSTLLDNIPDFVYFKDGESRFTRINSAMVHWLGIADASVALGRSDADFFSGEHAREALEDEQEIMRTARPMLTKEERETRFNAEDRWVTTSKFPLHDPEGNLIGTFGISRDITRRKLAEQAVEDANSKLTGWVKELEMRDRESALLSDMGELLETCCTEEEADEVVTQFAREYFQGQSGALCLTKASRNVVEVAARWGRILSDQVFAPTQCWALRRGRMHDVTPEGVRLICGHVSKDAPAEYVCIPMMANGESLGILQVCFDESVDRETAARLRKQAAIFAERVGPGIANLNLRSALRAQSIRDPLTGLFNRRYMEESLEREIRRAERNGKPLGAVIIDIDHFKRFNDTFGHEAGDVLLREFGALLRARTRKEDIACRLGGEEFILILPDAALEDTYKRAEELRMAVAQMGVSLRGQSLGRVTASMGVAAFPGHARSSDMLVRCADEALYKAKAQGRDRVVLASPAHIESSEVPMDPVYAG